MKDRANFLYFKIIKDIRRLVPEIAENVRGGHGTAYAHKLLDLYPGSAIKSAGVVRLDPGANVGAYSLNGDEDFFYGISGTGIVVDNGVEHPFTPVCCKSLAMERRKPFVIPAKRNWFFSER